MSKAAHNSCQAGADIPTGLGMRQKSTFAMSRLRHKRAVGKILPRNSGICLVVKIFSQNDEPLIDCKLRGFDSSVVVVLTIYGLI